MQYNIGNFFKLFTAIGSSICCLLLLFLACGHPPTQQVKVFVNKPKSEEFYPVDSVNVSIRFESFQRAYFKQRLDPGENTLILPKGSIHVLTGFLGSAKKDTEKPNFVYANISQDIQITQNTRSLEMHYPTFRPIQYKKYGLIFQKEIPTGVKSIPTQAVVIQEPIAESFVQNPSTGDTLGFVTDSQGHASVDLPIFDSLTNQFIQLFIEDTETHEGYIAKIPLQTESDNIEFYEITLGQPSKVKAIDLSKTHYTNPNKTIQTAMQEGMSPRFQNLLNTSEYKSMMYNFLIQGNGIDFLHPFIQLGMTLKTDNPYNVSGREIIIQCKPHHSAVYQKCERITSVQQLKDMFVVKSGDKFDLLMLDQDGYSVFTDAESTRDNPVLVTIEIP